MEKIIETMLVMITVIVSSLSVTAQTVEKTVTLVTSGDGATKEEAVKQALRSAIEQTFGTFVSANTEVLNDELIQDEIVTVSTGNITEYKEINSLTNKDGSYSTTVEATVSIGKLTNFARSKGMSVDLATGAFAMNMKIRELNKKNEVQAIKDLQTKLLLMKNSYNFFDYQLKIGEPYLTGDDYAVEVKVEITPNINLANFRNTIISTLKSLSLSEVEREEYERAKIPYKTIEFSEYESDQDFLSHIQAKNKIELRKINYKRQKIYLRNCDYDYPSLLFPWMMLHNELGFAIVDNIGCSVSFCCTDKDNHPEEKYLISHATLPNWALVDFEEKWRNSKNTIMEYWFFRVVSDKTDKYNLVSLVVPKSYEFYLMEDYFDISVHHFEKGSVNTWFAPAYFTFELKYPKEIFSTINNIELILCPPHFVK